MLNPDTADRVERALQRLVPTDLSQRASQEIEAVIKNLSGEETTSPNSPFKWSVVIGVAASIAIGLFFFSKQSTSTSPELLQSGIREEKTAPFMSFLAEANRVEDVSYEGLYTDAGGSAVRKVRVRVFKETSLRDEETGIVVKLSEPREEFHVLPVSNF